MHVVSEWATKNACIFRHLEFSLIDTTGMSEQQRREIPYTVVQSQHNSYLPVPSACPIQSTGNLRLDNGDGDVSSPARYDDHQTINCNQYNHPICLDDDAGSIVIV